MRPRWYDRLFVPPLRFVNWILRGVARALDWILVPRERKPW